jgi:hypothetical protein
MKKLMFALSLILLLSSCTEDVRFNNPAFQGLKDNVFWRAQVSNAYIASNGNVIVEGYLGLEKVTLQTASPDVRTYILGVDDISKAVCASSETLVFSTGKNIGSGQITITEFDSGNKTISGTFKFNAINSNASDTENPKVNFTEGVFYKVHITSGLEY